MSMLISPHLVRQVLFLILLIALGLFIANELNFLVIPCLGAITFYVILRKLMISLVEKRNWKRWVASLVLILLSLIIIMAPMATLLNFGYNKIVPVIQNPDDIKNTFQTISNYINYQFSINIIDPEYATKINNFLLEIAQKTIGETITSIGSFVMMYLLLYFMLYQFQDIEKWLSTKLPFSYVNSIKLVKRSNDLIISNALGIPIVALVQGCVGLLGYWIFGVKDFVLFGLLTGIGSVIPIVGSAIIYIPLTIYMFSQGLTWQGFGVGFWGVFIVGSSDNVARFTLQKYMSDTHPLVTVFGVVMGINVFGFLGVIFGPIILSLFVLLLNIYQDEYERGEGFRKKKDYAEDSSDT